MRIPRQARDEACTMQESRHTMSRLSIYDHAKLVNPLVNHEAIHEALRALGLPKIQLDLPAVHGSNLQQRQP